MGARRGTALPTLRAAEGREQSHPAAERGSLKAAHRQVSHRAAQGQRGGLPAPRLACGNGVQRRAGEDSPPPAICMLARGPIACEGHGEPKPLHSCTGGVQQQDPLCLCRALPLLPPHRTGTGGSWHSSHNVVWSSEKVSLGSYVHSLLFPHKFIIFHLVLRSVPY